MELYEGQLKDYKFKIKKTYLNKKDEEGHRIKKFKCFDIFTFDIEVTSAFIEDGEVIGYRPGYSEEYWNSLEKLSLCYIWQCSVNDRVFYGRELESFLNLLSDLPQADMIFFVHNLAYEFTFLLNIMEVESLFARTPQHPMKCSFKEYPNIEWRCSYTLTNMSLENWGKELGVTKKIGQLDYLTVRTPLTPLNEKELEYCEYDCIIVYEGIRKLLEEYETVFKLPLTSTGRIRRVFKKMLTSDKQYLRAVKKRIPSVNEYATLQHIYAGGWTHPNRLWANRVVHANESPDNVIEHYDFTSSYPYSMMLPYYPISRFFYDFKKELPTEEEFNSKCWILELELHDVIPTSFHSYIQNSKCSVIDPIYDNGRLAAAKVCAIKCTEFDWFIIRDMYSFSEVIVVNRYFAYKGRLNRMICDYVLQLYSEKTIYKNVEGMEDTYRRSKAYCNSTYGLLVTSICSSDVVFKDGEWFITPLTKEIVQEKLNKLKDYRDSQTGYFLDYSAGVWCTAISRWNLARCILGANGTNGKPGTNKGRNVLYYDTDSAFILGKSDYSWYNNEVIKNLKSLCKDYEIPFEKVSPKDKKGIEHTLGLFSPEESDDAFVSCHAKCYCEEREGQLFMTISGINKSAVNQLKDIYDFKAGKVFDKDDVTSKKNLHTYLHNMPEAVFPDGYISKYKHGINMRPTGYVIGVTDEYDRLNNFTQDFCDLPEHSIIELRGVFDNG